MRSTLLLSLLLVGICWGKSDVIDLTEKTFNKVLDSEELWMVEFFAPWCGHCKSLAPEWEKAATNLKGIVNIAKVDATVEQSLGAKYGIKGYPTIKVFMPGGKDVKKKPEDYQGGRTAKPIVDFALSKMGNHVTSVTDKSIDSFLSGRSDLPHVLLITDKSQTSPLYKSLSNKFSKKMVFGEARKGAKAVVEKFNVDTFPQLFVIKGDDHVKFEGKMDPAALASFLEKQAGHGGGSSSGSGGQKASHAQDAEEDAGAGEQKQYRDSKSKNAYHAPGSKAAAPPKKAKAAEVPELTGAKKGAGSLDAACTGRKGVCVIAVLSGKDEEESEQCGTEPPSAEKIRDAREAAVSGDDIAVFKEVAQKFAKDGTLHFSWVDASRQKEFVAALGAPAAPGVVVLKPGKRNRYTTLHGEYSVAGVTALLDRVIGGDATYTAIDAIPPLSHHAGCGADDDDDDNDDDNDEE